MATPGEHTATRQREGGGGYQTGAKRGRGGPRTEKIVCQQWPNMIFPTVNFVFSHDSHFGLGGEAGPGGGGGGTRPW